MSSDNLTEPATPVPSNDLLETALNAGLAAAFGEDQTPGGWSRPPLLRADPSEFDPSVQPPPLDVRCGSDDRYELLGEIARGGMGVVLKARDPDLGRDLAFKVVREEYAAHPQILQRFVEEAQIGGQLQHPGIVPIYDLGRLASGQPYFAMKLVKGRTLDDLLQERISPADERVRYVHNFLQVCQTMAYAHSKGVIHRDLKPANVMVGAFGEVLVMDWGLAKVLPKGADDAAAGCPAPEARPTVIHVPHENETASGSVMGTPAFMPPEQASGEIDKLDERADVFGLGAILCVILTGHPPFIDRLPLLTHVVKMREQLAAAYARLDDSGADAELVDLCKKCLSFDRDARPRNSSELVAAITGYITGVESRAEQERLVRAAAEARADQAVHTQREAEGRALKERKLRKMQLAFTGCACCLVVSLILGMWWDERREDQMRQERHDAAVKHQRLVDEKEAEEGKRRQLLEDQRDRKERRHQEITRLAEALSRARPRLDRTSPHPVEAVDTPPPVDYSAFRILDDRRIVDLRDWDQGKGAVTMTRRIRLMKISDADTLWFAGRTTGTSLIFRCVSPNPQTARLVVPREKERVDTQLMKASYLGVDVRDVPLNQEFEIQTVGTYWCSLQSPADWWFGVIGYRGGLRVSMLVLFPKHLPYTNDSRDALRVARPGEETAVAFTGEKTIYESQDRTWFYWEIPEPQHNHVYKFYWTW